MSTCLAADRHLSWTWSRCPPEIIQNKCNANVLEAIIIFVCGQWPKHVVISWVVVLLLNTLLIYFWGALLVLHFYLGYTSDLNLAADLGTALALFNTVNSMKMAMIVDLWYSMQPRLCQLCQSTAHLKEEYLWLAQASRIPLVISDGVYHLIAKHIDSWSPYWFPHYLTAHSSTPHTNERLNMIRVYWTI